MKLIFQTIGLIAVIVLAILALAAAKTFAPKQAETYFTDTAGDMIHVVYPKAMASTTSPLKVSGQARGNWYFEASFPVTIVNWDGLIIAEQPVQAKGDWMTTEFVPFEATIPFTKPECAVGADYCKRGAVIFKKDNPSGDSKNDAAVEVPIMFE